MTLETDLNQSPFFDDYNEDDSYHKILFRPSVSVQTRELNQLQTILQKQIERFGDNILKKGTIVDGCNFLFYSEYPYVKINDLQKDGLAAAPSQYMGLFAKSSNSQVGMKAFIVNYTDGFESTSPDLKTLYLSYINSGVSGEVNNFTSGEIITIYDPLEQLFAIDILGGGLAFSNSDMLIVSPAIVVNVSSGTFTNGEYINQPSTGANVQIINIDNITLKSSNQVILSIKPRTADLANLSSGSNTSAWFIANSNSIRNTSLTVTGSVEGIVGASANGFLTTDSSGKIIDIVLTERGLGYSVLPWATVKSANNTSGINLLSLSPRNYYANVQVSSLADSYGVGYAFGVTEGIVYQKGHFIKVEPQTIIVEKYNASPDALVVGFDTREDIIDSNIDANLLDNAIGTKNENAPGASRMKLTPELVLMTKEAASSNDNFFVLSEWSEGRPYKQNKTTAYNKINDEMATRTKDESGNFSVDRFNITTKSPSNTSLEGSKTSIVVDTGLAYIDGYRVETLTNYIFDIDKGTDLQTRDNQTISIDYENYITINEMGGLFQFSTGDLVDFYDTPKGFISNNASAIIGNTLPKGTKIGNGRIRSISNQGGAPGTANCVYKLYVFAVKMNNGKNFRDSKAVYYNGTNKGIADIVLTPDATLTTNVAIIKGTKKDSLVFKSGLKSIKSMSNVNYTYRTIDQTLTAANNTGTIIKDISSVTNEFFPYASSLSDTNLKQVYIIPMSNALQSFSAMTGTVSVNTTSANVVGTGTTFALDFQVGDFTNISNGVSSFVTQIVKVVNNTLLVAASNSTFTNATSTLAYKYFPKNVPIALGSRLIPGQTGHSANVDANGNILTIQFKHANGTSMAFNATTAIAASVAVTVDIERRSVVPSTKTANRKRFVKIYTGNNVGKTAGPWCLGVPDVFRLRSVFIGNSTISNTSANNVSDFYIDSNHTSSYADLSYLYKKPSSFMTLTNTDYLLVEFDYGTTSAAGFLNTTSYTGESNSEVVFINDSMQLADLTTKYNTFEIPEIYTNKGEHFDLINTIDFRPQVEMTVTPSAIYSTAPLNPSNTLSFGVTTSASNDKKFPIPQTIMRASISQYLGRYDSVFVNRDADIFALRGVSTTSARDAYVPDTPSNTMRINDLNIPPYPNISVSPSERMTEILNRRIANEINSNKRARKHTIKPIFTDRDIETSQPSVFTQADIGKLARRVSDIEYYISLTLLESDIKDRVIPSSTDPALNRFKYGFFVDDFSTTKFSEIDNPQYAAAIEDDDVVPEKEYIHMNTPQGVFLGDYIDFEIVSQSNSTKSPKATSNCQPDTETTSNWIVRQQKTSTIYPIGKEEIDIVEFTSASVPGPMNLYGYFYSGPNKIQIYQGSSIIYQSNSATTLTVSDKTKLMSNVVPSAWFSGPMYPVDLNKTFTIVADARGDGIKNAFKIAWTHNPSAGDKYKIVTTKYSSIWRWGLEYTINSNTVTCITTPNTSPVIYNGYMEVTPNNLMVQGF